MPAASKATLNTRPTRTRASRWDLTSAAAPGGGIGVIGSLLVGKPKRLLDQLTVGQELLRPALGLRGSSKRLPVPGAVQDAGVDAQLLGRPDGAQLAGKREGGDGELRITGQVAYTGLVLYPAELPQGTPGQIGGDVGAQC